jgi:beta-aspartyl-peptidase (threonine type)
MEFFGAILLSLKYDAGKDLRCGAVCGLKTVKNPIKLARLVMQETPHIFLGFEVQ